MNVNRTILHLVRLALVLALAWTIAYIVWTHPLFQFDPDSLKLPSLQDVAAHDYLQERGQYSSVTEALDDAHVQLNALGVHASATHFTAARPASSAVAHAESSVEPAFLTAPDSAPGDQFGWSVAIDGDIAIVGTPHDDDHGTSSGAAYIFARSQDGMDNWTLVKKLTAHDGEQHDFFGGAVAISGDIAFVGVYGDDVHGSRSGSVYLFGRNEGGSDNWGFVDKITAPDGAANDHFGISLAVSEGMVIVGAHNDNDHGTNSGSAYIFEQHHCGSDSWVFVAKLTAPEPHGAPQDFFGTAVAINGDVAIVGADGDDDHGSRSGSAYVFQRNQDGSDNWGFVKKLMADNPTARDFFGSAVAVNGDIAIVGVPRDDEKGTDAGAAYLFERNQGGSDNWGLIKKLTADDAAAHDFFGHSVTISGNDAIIGAYGDDDHGGTSGSAYVFSRDQDGTDNWGQAIKLYATHAAAIDRFGYAVAAGGDSAIIGAWGDKVNGNDSGSAYIYNNVSSLPSAPAVFNAANTAIVQPDTEEQILAGIDPHPRTPLFHDAEETDEAEEIVLSRESAERAMEGVQFTEQVFLPLINR